MKLALAAAALLALPTPPVAAQAPGTPPATALDRYLDNTGLGDSWTGGERMVPIEAPGGPFKVWIRRTGNNPAMKLLLLHGGPAMGHDYMAAFDSFLPATGIEYYQYDQLGAGWSDRPDNDALWTIERYVDEVDQVRAAIGGDADNFCLLGHSWGGILAIEYALAHPDKVKCLVISNMMASIPAYNAYADAVLKPQVDPASLALITRLEAEGKTDDPAYMGTLIPAWYEQHVLRRPFDEWPVGVMHSFERVNTHIYTLMQGPSEMGAGGTLARWDRFSDLPRIAVPTLVISGKFDTMDPAHMAAMARALPQGELLATNGSHMAMYDDQAAYFAGLTTFLLRQAHKGH